MKYPYVKNIQRFKGKQSLSTVYNYVKKYCEELWCVSEPLRGRVSVELCKPVERKGAMSMSVVLDIVV